MKEIGIRIGLIIAIAIFMVSGWHFLAPLFQNQSKDVPARFIFPPKEDVGMIMPPQTIAEAVAERLRDNPLGLDEATRTGKAIMTAVKETPVAPTPEPTPLPTATPAPPVVIAQGQFVDGDVFHKGAGTATLLQAGDGTYLLRFTDFTTSVGPDLRVLLSPAAAPASQARLGDYLEVDRLKGNIGDQEYTLPADFDPTAYQSVVIYCRPFRVIFATATLQ